MIAHNKGRLPGRTTAKTSRTSKSYQPASTWSSAMNALLGTLLLTCQRQNVPKDECRNVLEHVAELIRIKSDLGLIRKDCSRARKDTTCH
jgi:hypothetical protein